MKIEYRRRIMQLSEETKVLVKIRKMINTLVNNTLYYEKNMEQITKKYNEANIPECERKLIEKAMKVQKRRAEEIKRELEQILEKIIEEDDI